MGAKCLMYKLWTLLENILLNDNKSVNKLFSIVLDLIIKNN
jgi:hypothetical protein